MPQDLSINLEYYLTCCASSSPIPLSVSLDCNNITVFEGADGWIGATPVGGIAPYTYLWSDTSTSQYIYNLVPGTYSVTVTDGNSHIATASCTITQPDLLSLRFIGTPPLCPGGNGLYDIEISGGVPPYNYYWYINSNYYYNTSVSLPAGPYYLYVDDSIFYSTDISGVLTNPTSITAEMDGNNESYTGANDGTATVTASGGTPGYTYLWNTGATTVTITGLSIGVYTVIVTDSRGCTANFEYIVGSVVPKFLFYKPDASHYPFNSLDVIDQYNTGIFLNTDIEDRFPAIGTPSIATISIWFTLVSGGFVTDVFYADTTSSLSFWTDVEGWLQMNDYAGIVYDIGTDKWLIDDPKNISYVEIFNSTP